MNEGWWEILVDPLQNDSGGFYPGPNTWVSPATYKRCCREAIQSALSTRSYSLWEMQQAKDKGNLYGATAPRVVIAQHIPNPPKTKSRKNPPGWC